MAQSAEPRLSLVRPSPLDLPAFLPYASAQLQAPYRVRVLIETQEEYVSKAEDKSKKSAKNIKSTVAAAASRTRTSSQEQEDSEGSPPPPAAGDANEVLVTAVQDAAGRLVELALTRCREIPRLLMQIVALSAPHQPLLARLSVRWATLPGEALHEIAKFIPLSQITEVRLDDSPVPEKNYRALLEHDRLRCLSLARCDLGDEDCAALAERLAHPEPASRGLCALGLASNRIGDAGAVALGAALRSNRALQHLDLGGNRVTDEGARELLRSLVEFPLTYEEIVTKRRRHFEYLRRRREVFLRCVESLAAAAQAGQADEALRGRRRTTAHAPASRSRKSVAGSPALAVGAGPSSLDAVAARAETLTNELVGAHFDPFSLEETVSRDRYVHSLGNGALCYLNLAYNAVGPGAVGALLAVLRAQAARRQAAGGAPGGAPGLLRVLLEGNPLPPSAPEYALIDELLEQALLWKLSKQLKKGEKLKIKAK